MLMKILGKTLCFLRLHAWEKEPSEKDIVKGTGMHFAFWSESYQKATQHCERSSCSATRQVYQYGFCGAGGGGFGWKKLSLTRSKYIDSLPNVYNA